MPLDPFRVVFRAKAELDRKGKCKTHADGDCLSMQEAVRISGIGLERVAESMTEIEQRPRTARLAFVLLEHLGLGTGARLTRITAFSALTREDLGRALLEPGEERGIAEQPVF